MATKYVDLEVGSDAGTGADWANAYKTIQKGLTDALAGGTCFVRRTNAGTPGTDTAAASRTLTSPGTAKNPTLVLCCKDATTAEPPTDSDLMVRGTDTLALFEATGGGSDITLVGGAKVHGMRVSAADRLADSTQSFWYGTDCELYLGGLFFLNTGSHWLFDNSALNPTAAGVTLLLRANSLFEMNGGLLSGTAPTTLITTSAWSGGVNLTAVDLSNLSAKTIVNLSNMASADIYIRNCKMPASYTFASGTPGNNVRFKITRIASTDATALGSSDSVQDFLQEQRAGTVETETTAVRTGGSSDGVGVWAQKLTPRIDMTLESAVGVESLPILGWVDGDGTSKTFTVYIANSGGADYNKDDVRLKLFIPDDGGTTQHDLAFSPHDKVPGGTTAITDDAVSAWGTGAANAQKLEVTASPDYKGPVYGVVEFMKRFSSSPESLFVDGKVYVT